MIIDFNYPNLTSNGWQVGVSKETPKTHRLVKKEMKFKTKEEAFAYYEHVKQMWRNQKQRS